MRNENIYLIELFDDKEKFYKIGTSVHRYCRFYEIMKSGYKVNIVCMVFDIEPTEAFKAEAILQESFQRYKPNKKFGGHTECFSFVGIEEYKNILFDSISSHGNLIENLPITWR